MNYVILPFLLLILFYVMIIRPAQRRRDAAVKVASVLLPGAEVMTTAGLFGTVRSVGDDDLELEIAPGVVVRYVKAAIAKVVEPAEPTDDDTAHEELPKNSADLAAPSSSVESREDSLDEHVEPGSPDRPATPPTLA